jgi:uncharacterized iron-regulated membrane protein
MKTWPLSTESWRAGALIVHRYVGLFLTVFLVTAGLTGSLLAFYQELDTWVNPHLLLLPSEELGMPDLDPFEVRRRALTELGPEQHFDTVKFATLEGQSVRGWIESTNGTWREVFISPKSGKVLGSRAWGDLSEGRKNLMPFVYRLHYSLALGDTGIVLFGVIALLWTLDCFVGAYLTLPRPVHSGRPRRSFWGRWLPAWTLKTHRLFALMFTWHRASGLWIWALLFVFAWSGVGFNLRPIYRPVMAGLFGMQPEGHELLPLLDPPNRNPRLTLEEAWRLGRQEMAREAEARGFRVLHEVDLYYASDHGAYAYAVESSLDISRSQPRTEVYLDGQTGRFLGFSAPRGISAGNTLSSWLSYLHRGAVFGLGYRLLVVMVGLMVALLSGTGVVIWWRKRTRRASRTSSQSGSLLGDSSGLPLGVPGALRELGHPGPGASGSVGTHLLGIKE